MNDSPWADGSVPDEPTETTAELLVIAERERAEREAEAWMNDRLWKRYANRLTRDGNLIR